MGLLVADKDGKSDPYVVVRLGNIKYTSRTIRKTLDPVWNQSFEFKTLTLGQVLQTRLLLQAYDYDGIAARSDPLGELSVELHALEMNDLAEFGQKLSKQGTLQFSVEWVPAVARPCLGGARQLLSVKQLGRSAAIIQDPATRMAACGTLKVHLLRASGLVAADSNGKSDPYVEVSVKGTLKRSSVKHQTLDPQFNETLEFGGPLRQMVLRELVDAELAIRVLDSDGLSNQDIGEVNVQLDRLKHEDDVEYAETLSTQGVVHFRLEWVPA
eukprot:7365567-Prymnesium_polylepis.1